MKRYLTATGLLLIATLGSLQACRGAKEAAGEAARDSAAGSDVVVLGPEDVATATRVDLIAGVPVSGALTPAVAVRLTATLGDVVQEVLVKEGQRVRAGQPLARFDDAELKPVAASAEAQRRLAEADYARMQNLFKEGAVAQRDVENAEVVLRAADATAVQALKRLEDATIRAPVAGIISRREVDGGDRVSEGDPMFEVVSTAELELEAVIPSEYAASVRVGAAVALVVTGLPGAGLGGRVARINPVADPATRQVKVYVNVPNAGGRLVAGLFASGRLILREVRGAVAVPRPGVRTDEQGRSYLLLVADGRIARREVGVGAVDEQAALVEIVTGLADGATVIVGPIEGLEVGQRVELAGREG